jgi:hypothetical protein
MCARPWQAHPRRIGEEDPMRQHDTPPPHPPAVRTARRRHQLRIAIGAAVLAITLAACGSTNNARPGSDPHATPAAESEQHTNPTSQSDRVRLPDLTQPATRKQFVCSFANGYFNEPQPPPDNPTSDYCGPANKTASPSSGPPSPTTTTIHLIGHETQNAHLDLGAPGPSLGDEVVFSGPLLRPGSDQAIGHYEGTLTAVTPDANPRFLAFVVLALPDGQVAAQGELNFATQTEFVHAITGGTGAYRHARGEFHFRHTANKGVIDITLQLDQA